MFGKTKTKGFFDKARVLAPEEEWIVVDNAHEPIISYVLWDTVHQLMKGRRRENGNGEVQMFAGLVKCSTCGASLNAILIRKKANTEVFLLGL